MDRKRILIVEDSPTMRQLLVFALRRMKDVDIVEAQDGMDGLRKVSSDHFDLALIDINMPVMNGEEMIDQMLKDPDIQDIPIVVISTEGSKTRVERLQKKGARFIHKPFTPEIIRDAVKDILGDKVFDGAAA